MNSYLRITRHPYEEPYHLNLVIEASNGRLHGALEVYVSSQDLSELPSSLRGFPSKNNETVRWELGSERPSDRSDYYFRLQALKVSAYGQCAIALRFNNNRPPPECEIVEFSIRAEPADIERLTRLLDQFSGLEHSVLEWTVTDGQLHRVQAAGRHSGPVFRTHGPD